MRDRLQVVVHGRVQGVGFRWFVRGHARRLGIVGWVRNSEAGTVEIAAEGEATALDAFRQLLSRGPDGAQVVRLEPRLTDDSGIPLSDPFSILR